MTNSGNKFPVIGFIGLGAMGGRMAVNLLRAGYTLIGFDIDATRLSAVVSEGAKKAADIEEVVKRSDYVLTSLPSSEVFVDTAENHLIPAAKKGQVFIDLGTVVPTETRRIAELFKSKGATLMDVPVTGGIHGAEKGTLGMFIGGDRQQVEKILPVLKVLGDPDKIVYCGPSGAGQIVKGVNQLAMGLYAAAFLEAVAFGVRLGVDPGILADTVGGDDGWRREFRNIANKVIQGEGSSVSIKFGQLKYFIDEAERYGFKLPISKALHEFCDTGERLVMDANRLSPSFWIELMKKNR